ncbi:MAG: hypothetical protein HY976_00775, partial [Candidatus Kerfeldbacteria bacterium]|nr:hypothetical protein [Candidatus Kerfeldbacteria bacterium]
MPATRHHLYRQLAASLAAKQRVLLVTHEHADGDAFGSMLGFQLANPAATTALAPDSSPVNFSYLTGIENVEFDATRIDVSRFDAVVMFDCGDVKRTHLAEQLLRLGEKRPLTAVIDHHPTRTEFSGQD